MDFSIFQYRLIEFLRYDDGVCIQNGSSDLVEIWIGIHYYNTCKKSCVVLFHNNRFQDFFRLK